MSDESRVTTGIAGLDTMLQGGFIPESAILVRGAPGTGKTTLGFHFIMEGAKRGEKSLLVSFEEFPKSLYRDAASIGCSLTEYEKNGSLHMMFTSPLVLLRSIESPDSPLMQTLLMNDIRRVVVDSITHFTRVSADSVELRNLYNRIVNAFRREGVTAMFLGEEMRSDFTADERGRLSFVVDCIVMLRYLEIESTIQRAILVLKMRSSDHDKAIHSYAITSSGITVGEPMEGRIGLLNGLSRRSIISTVQSAR
jgi:circadian clock protein KaiC